MLHNFRPAYLDDSGYDAPSHLQACISILLMENIMEVHNFSIFILRFFSILISALIEKKRKCIWRKYPLFSPLSAIKSGVSILPIIWRKNGTEYGENFHFFLRFFSIMIFPFFSPLSAIKSGVSILPSIRFSAFRIWRIYGDLRYGMIPPWNIHTVKQSMPRSCSNGCSLNWFTPPEFFQFSQLTN